MDNLYKKAIAMQSLSVDEALVLYREAPLNELAFIADQLRNRLTTPGVVSWQIDRNVNITNVCVSGCKFCNFHVRPIEKQKSFITTIDQYLEKIQQTLTLGGDQLLLQGGLHPGLDIGYYETLFRELKKHFPQIKLHALGPPEIVHIARISAIDTKQVLERLVQAGLDSLPGAGAEILDNELRKKISPGKCSAEQWLDVMREAHKINLPTSATMMYGHLETPRERIEHLVRLRDLQAERPDGSRGFINFIPWIFCRQGTILDREYSIKPSSELDYLRIIAISRIVLYNIPNIQASWLTVGIPLAQLCLYAGANDLGSIMIEENVVSSAGASFRLNAEEMCAAIRQAGFTPYLRDQQYNERII